MLTKNKNLLKFYTVAIIASLLLPLGQTKLNAAENEDGFIVVKPKETQSASEKESTDFLSKRFEKISSIAKDLLGTRYRSGGSNPNSGFDCSGFVSYVFKEGADIKLPRSSREMRTVGKAVDLKSLKPGDLIFFRINTSHVGIYIGDNRFIHAPSTGRSVAIDSLNGDFFQNKIIGARRILTDSE